MSAPDIACAQQVLSRFGVSAAGVHSLGSHGGFSGAALWKVDHPDGSWRLKAWPDNVSAEHLRHVHWLMRQARAAGLEFVPLPHESADGGGCVSAGGRFWDLTSWQPGQADFHARSSVQRLEAACVALAELHRVWRPARLTSVPIPAVRRRLAAAEQWLAQVKSGWAPDFRSCGDSALEAWAERAWVVLGYSVRRVHQWLAGWMDARLPVHPCHCDVWHDHVLFTGAEVTGIIDFGSVKTDHPAVDLARLLGSLVEDDRDLREAGLDAYDNRSGLSRDERALVDALDRTGTILSLTNWLRWLFAEGRTFEESGRIGDRIAALVRRVESW